MKTWRCVYVAGAAVSLLPLAGVADTINFDDLNGGDVVTDQYISAVFSTIQGQETMVHPFSNGGNSSPNILCTAAFGVVNCTQPVFVDFPNPVNDLMFLAVEPNEFGVVATISIFQNGNHTDDVDLIGLGLNDGEFGSGNVGVDLSGYANITRIEILGPGGQGSLDSAYGGAGIGWDDFSYTPVPGPGTLALLVIGAGLACGRRRK